MTDTFGRTLKALREASHTRNRLFLSQARLAEVAGLDHSTISRLESGARRPSRDVIERLAMALDLTDEERERLSWSAGFVPRGNAAIESVLQELDHLREELVQIQHVTRQAIAAIDRARVVEYALREDAA